MSLITLDDIVKLKRFNNIDNVEIQSADGVYIKFEDVVALNAAVIAQCHESIRKHAEKYPDYYKQISVGYGSFGNRCSVCGSSKAKQQQFTTESGTIRPIMCDSCFREMMYEDFDV